MGKQELDSIGDRYALLLASLVECEGVLRVEEENMQNFFYLQETLVFNKTAASIRQSSKEGPYQDRPPLYPFRLLTLLIYSGSTIAFLKILKVQGPKSQNIENVILLQP